MLRTLVLSAVALTAVTGFASAQPRAVTPVGPAAAGVEVRADDGTVLGRITRVERNARGRVVAAEAPGLEPADAPRANNNLLSQNDQPRVSYSRPSGGGIFENETRTR